MTPSPQQQRTWTAKRGKYVHQIGCSAGPDGPCTCEPPYPVPKAAAVPPLQRQSDDA